MYTLLVGGSLEAGGEEDFQLIRSRFLEYTDALVAAQFKSLSIEAEACLKSWPCLRMAEGRGVERAFVCVVEEIASERADIQLKLRRLEVDPPLINDTIWRLREDLDIEQFEFSRYHWAIKDRSLIQILGTAGHSINPIQAAHFEELPLPAPPRSALIALREVIADGSQSDIDDLLLEAGVPGLDVPRSIGSRRDRAHAIIRFVVDNPDATTAGRSLLSAFLIRRYPAVDLPQNTTRSSTRPLVSGQSTSRVTTERTRAPNRVFVVHGRDEASRGSVVSFLNSCGLEAIVLHEQANLGRHLLTKFMDEAALATFAVVLMTGDDQGGIRGGELHPRARQNVILELGYFLAHIGQAGVCALVAPGVETPSDFHGIVYITMDESGQWRSQLLRELRAADLPVREQ